MEIKEYNFTTRNEKKKTKKERKKAVNIKNKIKISTFIDIIDLSFPSYTKMLNKFE